MAQKNHVDKKTDWLRLPEAVEQSKLNKNVLYDLINTGEVKSSLIKRRGSTRGIRLISRPSLNAYIESQATN